MKRSKANASVTNFSKDVLALNPDLGVLPFEKLAKQAIGEPRMPTSASERTLGITAAKKGKKRKEMNATEAEFALFLKAQYTNHHIDSWGYEEITLRWPDGMRYTGDFHTVQDTATGSVITIIEVKGAHEWQKDVVKFRAARDKWGCFEWEYWQKTSTGWSMTR